jgi:anti-sigma B factor antagonist
MPLSIAVEQHPPQVHVVRLSGRLDSAGTPTLRASLDELLQSGSRVLLFECSELRYVSSVGLGLFVDSAKSLKPEGGRVCFAGLTQHVRSVFDMVGFLTIFEVYPSLEAALDGPLAAGDGQ